jgi:L-ascorbate metabolism protein UlaG (beta-lactamase superfamily)
MSKRTLFLLIFVAQSACAGLEHYYDLVVSDARRRSVLPQNGVRITYLGTNSYQFEAGHHALLVDPYLSRVGVSAIIFGAAIQPDAQRINDAMKHLAPRADAILVTHGHVDHLFDAPPLMKITGARLLASGTAVELAEAAGAPPQRCDAVARGDVRQIGPWKIHVIGASHDRVFPIGVLFPGPRKSKASPKKAADWVCGEPLSFLIEVHGQRIFIDAGGTRSLLPPANIGPVDLAILGVALPDSRARFPEAVRRLRPRYVLPSHQDNFFRPLDRKFAFGLLTDFPRVLRDDKREQLPGQLILLDYFQPWTLR